MATEQNFDPNVYDDVHKNFLQILMTRGILTSKESLLIYADCLKNCGRAPESVAVRGAQLRDVVAKINEMISPLYLRIKQTYCEYTGKQLLVLKNTLESSMLALKQMSVYSQNEMEFIKNIIGFIMESEDGQASSVRCINSAETLDKKLSKHDADNFISQLKTDGWLMEKNGQLLLSSKAIIDLESYLLDEFDAQKCSICSNIVVSSVDQVCDHCETRTHKYCLSRFMKNRKQLPKCPNSGCGELWKHSLPEARPKPKTARIEDDDE